MTIVGASLRGPMASRISSSTSTTPCAALTVARFGGAHGKILWENLTAKVTDFHRNLLDEKGQSLDSTPFLQQKYHHFITGIFLYDQKL